MKKWKRGEQLVIDYLLENGYEVEDVSSNPDYFDKDIDLIATNPKTNGTAAIEIKTDSRISQTGNLYIEYSNIRSKHGWGWLYFTKADFIYYIDEKEEVCYIMRRAELTKYVNSNTSRLKRASTNDGSSGYLLPLDKAPIFTIVEL